MTAPYAAIAGAHASVGEFIDDAFATCDAFVIESTVRYTQPLQVRNFAAH